MANLDKRIVRLGIEIAGNLEFYEDLAIKASGTKYASGIADEADIEIYNLKKSNRDYLTTALSPYNLQRVEKKVILEAGRQSSGAKRIFTGDVISVQQTQPPDIGLKFKAMTSQFYANVIVAHNLGASNLSLIAETVANDLSLPLNFQATDKRISNYSYTGSAIKQVPLLDQMGGVRAFISDDQLVVKDIDKPLQGRRIILNESTGMIGMPQLDLEGVSVKFLIDQVPIMGDELEIQSQFYPIANGVYEIYKLNFEVTNRDNPFYWIAKGSRPLETN